MTHRRVPLLGVERLRMGTDGDGVTALVAVRGCPLHCRYCINQECHQTAASALAMTPAEVVERCRPDHLYYVHTHGGITLGGGEPLLYPDFAHALRQAMPAEWALNIETSLHVPAHHISLVAKDIDTWYIDVKDMAPDVYLRYTGAPGRLLYDNLRLLQSLGLQHRCVLRIPLIPGYNTEAHRQESVRQLRQLGFTQFDLFEYQLPSHD